MALAEVEVLTTSEQEQLSAPADEPKFDRLIRTELQGGEPAGETPSPPLAEDWLERATRSRDPAAWRRAAELLCADPENRKRSVYAAEQALKLDRDDIDNWTAVLTAHACTDSGKLGEHLRAMGRRFPGLSLDEVLVPLWPHLQEKRQIQALLKSLGPIVRSSRSLWREADIPYAMLLGRIGRAEEGLKWLRRVDDPETTERARLSLLHYLNRHQEIIEEFDTCRHSSDPASLYLCKSSAIQMGRLDMALTLTRKMIQLDPFSPSLHLELASLLISLADPEDRNIEEAEHALAVAADLGSTAAQLFLASLAEGRGDKRTAVEHYFRVGTPERFSHSLSRGIQLLQELRALPEALERINAMIQARQKPNATLLVMRGELYARMHDFAQAEEAFAEALRTDPVHLGASMGYSYALLENGDERGALRLTRQLLDQHPDNPNVLNMRGYTLAVLGTDLAVARKLIEDALIQRPANAAFMDSLGWVEYQDGNLERALELLETSWVLEKNSEFGLHLGQLLWRLNRREDAERVWRQAAELYPVNPKIEDILDEHLGR
ncbi:MAG: tetratricopeptide repeat protein [Gammaproteobacteria bacterium AqS3]|nr:tetratricopeptide repeat protein [Gammaproteobacteria bacterium AqS3]